jgi:hypothetical protein
MLVSFLGQIAFAYKALSFSISCSKDPPHIPHRFLLLLRDINSPGGPLLCVGDEERYTYSRKIYMEER